MNQNKAVIITPPLYSPEFPQLGPPVLKGFLQAHGHDCRQIDLNITFREHFMEKITVDSIINPDHQQNIKEIKDTLIYYFTGRFMIHIGRETGYLKKYFCDDNPGADYLEQFNAEVNAGMGFCSIVNSNPVLLSRFVRDRENNYYHQFITETKCDRDIAGTYNIIGFSLLSMTQFIAALTLSFRFKEINPNITIVLGGPWITLFAEELGAYRELFDFYDIIVQGEGELPFLEILKSADPSGYKLIPNIWIRENGHFRKPVAFYRADLDELPAPNYDGLPLRSYRAPVPVLVQGTRGCYWGKCAFCIHTSGVHAHQAKAIRVRPMSKLLADIDTLVQKHNPRFIVFADVSMTPAICRKLSEAFIERKYKFRWFIFLRFEESFTEELFGLMSKANCLMLNFGLESGSQRMLDKIDKGINLDAARGVLKNALKFNFRVTIHTMAGLPGESMEDLQKTVDFIKEYLPNIYESFTETFRLERNTRIFLNPAQFQVTISNERKIFDNAIPFSNDEGIGSHDAIKFINNALYSYYNERKDLVYAFKSFAGLKLKDIYEEASELSAGFKVKYKDGFFEDRVRLSTHGGGILKNLPDK